MSCALGPAATRFCKNLVAMGMLGWLAATLHLTAQAQGAASEARWYQMWQSGDTAGAFAMAEKLVASGLPVEQAVRLRAQLAIHYRVVTQYEHAQRHIDQATALSGSFGFRMLNDGGESGYQRRRAQFMLFRAQCQMAIEFLRLDAARTWCDKSTAEAKRVVELQRFGDAGVATTQHIESELDQARLELLAARHAASRSHVDAAGQLIAQHGAAPGTLGYHVRVASSLAVATGDPRRSVALVKGALEQLERNGVPAVAAPVIRLRESLQIALVSARDWPAALAEFDDLEALVARQPGNAGRVNLMAKALTYAHNGRLALLIPQLTQAHSNWSQRLGTEHPRSAVMRGFLGTALLKQAADPKAQAQGRDQLARACQELLDAQQAGAAFADVGLEAQSVRFVLEQFLRLQQSQAGDARSFVLAFQVADVLRGSRVQAAIEDASLRLASGAATGALGQLVQREQDVRLELRALENLLAGQTAQTTGPEQTRLTALQDERKRLRATIRSSYPAFAALVNPRPPTPEDVLRRLALGELFVLLLPVEDGVHVWSIGWQEQGHRFVAAPQWRVNQAVQAIRASIELDRQLKPYAVEQARWLGTQLLGHLQGPMQQARHLVLAAGGVLGSVPFAALPTGPTQADGEPWLVRRVAVSQVPSASAWLAIQRLALADRPQGALLAWGDPVYDAAAAVPAGLVQTGTTRAITRGVGSLRSAAPDANLPRYSDLAPLPETRAELLAIARALKADPVRDLILGDRATRASVLAASRSGELAQRLVVAFATHGLMAGELPDLNQPALAMATTPAVAKDPLSPLLTLDDVLGLRLNADWVVLSACNTAAADGRAEEAMSGLARGFFYAGARSVLVTQWAVETESAQLLTTRTFEHFTSNPFAGKAESLRQAMLQVMALPNYAHPAFWSPYTLVGDGGR